MDDAAFWVGPTDDPDRYRLTHLLGAGGEGEVWRATRSDGSDEVAIKIDTVPDAADDSWERKLRFLTSLNISGLVRIADAFTGPERHRLDDRVDPRPSHRYVVMNHVDGLTLRAWLDEHPGASTRRRIKILRGVARTLSRLHDGAGGPEPITHGDVKPSNVIIGADGEPVVVDLGLVRPAGSGPASGRTAAYSSPELRNPDSTPTPRTDTFSFAVTAMETLTGLTPPLDVDGTLDLGTTRSRIRSASCLRTRPLVRHQLLRSLTAEPKRRPGTPVRVFAGRAVALVVVLALVVLGGTGSAFALLDHRDTPVARPLLGSPTAVPGPPSPTAVVAPPRAPASGTASASPTATPTTTTVDDGSILSGSLNGGSFYSIGDDCDTVPNPSTILTDPLPNLATWGGSSFGVTLSAHENLEVLSVTALPTSVAGPRRLTQTLRVSCPKPTPPEVSVPNEVNEHCPPPPPFRLDARYLGNADNSSWHELLGKDHRPFGVSDTRCYRASSLSFDIDDCHTNADYAVTVTFRKLDDPTHLYTRTFPVIQMRAYATNALFTTSLEGLVTDTLPFTGGPDGCRHSGIRSIHPYASPQSEAYTLLIKRIRQVWLDDRSLTTVQAIDKVIEQLSGKYRRVLAPYDAATLQTICAEARTDPKRWRGTCGGGSMTASTASPTASPTATPSS